LVAARGVRADGTGAAGTVAGGTVAGCTDASGAVLSGAVLSGAVLSGAGVSGSGAQRPPGPLTGARAALARVWASVRATGPGARRAIRLCARAAVLVVAVWAGAGAEAAAPASAPAPAPRPGAAKMARPPSAPALMPGGAALRGTPVPAARPRLGAPPGVRVAARPDGRAAASAPPIARPRATKAIFVPDPPAHSESDLADDGPDTAHGASAPGEVTGGTRLGFAAEGIALIGIFGSPGDWRALLRLRSGKVDYVHVGARLDDWRVVAISARQVEMARGLQRRMLEIAIP
jgi:hypothetical protein